jgi:hypothetical protein
MQGFLMKIPFTQLQITKQRKATQDRITPISQTRESSQSPFESTLADYKALNQNLGIYKMIREAVPILDVAVLKYVRLMGNFRLDGLGNKTIQDSLDNFQRQVRVGWFDNGFGNWQDQLVDSAVSLGMGFGEVVPQIDLSGIHRLKIADATTFRFVKDGNSYVLGQIQSGEWEPIKMQNQEYLHCLSFDQRNGEPQGYSMFYSLPFMTQIFLRIQKAIDNQIWRVGDPSFIVAIEGGKASNAQDVKSLSSKLQDEITSIMKDRKQGKVRDAHIGLPNETKLNLMTLGANNELFDLEVPIHAVLEQIVSKTGFAPFMFGLYKWSSTERLSTHQNDMIVSTIKGYRTQFDSILEKTISTHLILEGNAGAKWQWEWNDVNLLDEVERARSRHLTASAKEKELKNILSLYFDYELISEQEAIDNIMILDIVKSSTLKTVGKEALLESLNTKRKLKSAANIYKNYLQDKVNND